MLRTGKESVTDWVNDAYDELVERARRVMDQAERMRLYGRAEEILVREAPFFPLAYINFTVLVKPWVRNYRPVAIGAPVWKDVIIDPH
jgi:ABC-type transport system substrate-binding protein